MNIRKINKTDIKTLAIIMSNSFKEYPWNENWPISSCEERIIDILSIKTSLGFVFLDNENIIGGCIGYSLPYMDKKEFNLIEFFISNEYKHSGLGKIIFGNIKEEIKKEGIDSISLETIPEVEGFYLKCGLKRKDTINLKIQL